jgi:hypothetical protein
MLRARDHAKHFFQRRVVLAVTASYRCLHNCHDEDGLRHRQHNECSSLTSWILSRHHLHTVLTTCLLSPPCCHHYQKLLTSDLIPLIRYPKPFRREYIKCINEHEPLDLIYELPVASLHRIPLTHTRSSYLPSIILGEFYLEYLQKLNPSSRRALPNIQNHVFGSYIHLR